MWIRRSLSVVAEDLDQSLGLAGAWVSKMEGYTCWEYRNVGQMAAREVLVDVDD